MIGPLTRQLLELCGTAEAALSPGPTRERITALAARLAEPRIRVAVGGRLNAGKSTLVNALIRQRLAPTGETETTRLVTWFRYAHQDRLRLHLRDGTTRLVPPAPGGGLPESGNGWGVSPDDLTHLTVEASNSALNANHTIIDTPGLDSPSALDRMSLDALAYADAVVYLMPHPGENDIEAVEAARSWSGSLHFTAASMIGVLSRIDVLGDGQGDPWPKAREVAQRYANDLRATFADVLPVAGLLGETALGAEFAESDIRALLALHAADPYDVEDALTYDRTFAEWEDAPISATARRRLISMLGRYGIRVALSLVGDGHTSAHALLDGLRRRSGIDAVLDRIEHDFVASADRLRATAGVAALRELGWADAPEAAGVVQNLQAEVDRLSRTPAMRQVELASALADLEAGRFKMEPEDVSHLTELARGHDVRSCLGLEAYAPDHLVEKVTDEHLARWHTLEMRTSSRLMQRHARTAREFCEQLFLTE